MVRVLSYKREVSSSNPIANRGDRVRLPWKSGQSRKHFFCSKNSGNKKIRFKNNFNFFCD